MAEGPIRAPQAAVAVAASAGGVEALTEFTRSLPGDFPGVVLVVLHLPEAGPSVLPSILGRASALRVVQASSGIPLEAGLVVVAPPGQHLRIADQHVELDRGPRENGHRPSADALFRTVAHTFGPRAAGVVLSGTMDDGAAGLRLIAEHGGFTVVQDPNEAAFPGMPAAAIAVAKPEVVCPAAAIGPELATWVAGFGPSMAASASRGRRDGEEGDDVDDAELSEFTCPECGGTLWLESSYGNERYRCRVGHAFSARSLLVGKEQALEAALWAAIVALEERADVLRRLLKRLSSTSHTSRLSRYRSDIERTTDRIELLRGVINELAHEPIPEGGGTSLERDAANDGN